MTFTPPLRKERHFDQRVVDCYPDRPANLDAMLAEAVARHPDTIALIDGALRLTYADLNAEVGRVAGGLAARNVGAGDRVAVILGNGAPFVILCFAVARLGAIFVPMSIRDQMPGIRHALTQSESCVLVVEADLAGIVPPPDETPHLRARFAIGAAEGFDDYARLRGAAPHDAPSPADEEDVATILYTSGTTGVPKGAMLTGLGIIHSATSFVTVMGLGPRDSTIVTVPMNHVTGLVACIHTMVRAAGTMIAQRAFKAPQFLALAAQEGMTFSVMVPAMYNLCLHQADLSDYDLSRWRIGGYGGAPMPAATIERLAAALPGLGLMNVYGATELTSPATIMPADQTAARRLSVGLPAPGVEICVMDDSGREVPRGEAGELWIRGAMVVPGYWRNPEADAREFVAGFWKSGDIGSVDAEGFVHVFDRKKEMINRGGHKIYTAMVESVLTAWPGVVEAAVVPRPCPILGERVHAVVTIKPGMVAEDDLRRHCAGQLSDYQCPETYLLTEDPLPRNANGKIMKRSIA
ncbi:AMP-binding protein [Seohaeicola saemankumensis]|uniref:class I adenylate-forming enzyme family protein n=1 Tax=Seohaeicola TaxID=481178 RepID=UPI0007F4CAAE|nr:O-succinylbenzoic acid--CoA ligase [Rhodobacteraceae bacterium EhC02]